MNTKFFKSSIKAVSPPLLVSAYKKWNKKYGFFGDYSSWEEALADSTGYSSDMILKKVKHSMLQVRDGKVAYERDSVLFEKIEYSFPALAALLKVALASNGTLNVLDFGGSLGSSYYQCKNMLPEVTKISWNVVEQPQFVECGSDYFQNDCLHFYTSIDDCVSENSINLVLLSGVIQYLETPYQFIQTLLEYEFPYILIDITAFFKEGRQERLTVQKVDPSIYAASYPAWILSESKLANLISKKYRLLFDFDSLDSPDLDALGGTLRGSFWEKIS